MDHDSSSASDSYKGSNSLKSVSTYKRILEESFHIDISSIQFLGGGSHRVFEVNNNLIFKFLHGNPSELLKREKNLCNTLKDRLSIPVPYYLYFSETCPFFKGAFGGYKKLKGEPLQDFSTFEKKRTAHQIGEFLSELHAVDVDNRFSHKIARKELDSFYHRVQKTAFPVLNKKEREWTQFLFENFLENESMWNFAPVFVHGDFDSSNILYHPGKGVCSIIDFEEAGMGDPAWDFCPLLAEYGSGFLTRALKSYAGTVDEFLSKRISFHAKRIIFCELLYGIEFSQPEYAVHGLTRLKRAMNNCIIGSWLKKSASLTRAHEGFPE